MPSDCNTSITYRSYRKDSPVRRWGGVEKKPRLAPDPRKSAARILADLEAKIDTQIAARNGPVPQCSPCDFLNDNVVSTSRNLRDINVVWRETFELRDADGNVIRGTAKYRAHGEVWVVTEVTERFCDEPFGDPEDAWETAMADPEEPNWGYAAGLSLEGYWAALPKDLKEDLEFIPAGSKPARKRAKKK